jgi:hypothetical protein
LSGNILIAFSFILSGVKSRLVKFEDGSGGKSIKDYDLAIKMIIDEALSSNKVVDIFKAEELKSLKYPSSQMSSFWKKKECSIRTLHWNC